MQQYAVRGHTVRGQMKNRNHLYVSKIKRLQAFPEYKTKLPGLTQQEIEVGFGY
jgi:hypothetical protein